MKFRDIPGHSRVKETLQGLVSSGKVPHALMLSGPSGVGKMMLARVYAQLLQCESPEEDEPCGRCQSCRLHADLSHPDLHFVYPVIKKDGRKSSVSADYSEEWKEMLSENPAMPVEKWSELIEAGAKRPVIYVDEASDIITADAYPAYNSRYKIFLIWLPERMNPETANKLLKVIEEPSEGTIFLMVSNNDMEILPTIYSRVQRIAAGRLEDAEVEQYLRRVYRFPEARAMQYAPLCGGTLIRADEFSTHTGENEEFLAMYQEVMRSAYAKRVARLRQLSEKVAAYGREKTVRYLQYSSRMLRENFIYNMKLPPLTTLTPEEEAFSTRFAPFINHLNVEDFLSQTDSAVRDIGRNANAKLVLFDYFLYCIILIHRKEKQQS